MEKKSLDINIRERMKTFLLDDVIRPCLKQPQLSNIKNSIIILDEGTAKIINSCVKMIDLVQEGIIGCYFYLFNPLYTILFWLLPKGLIRI